MLVKLLNTNQPTILFLLPFFTAILWVPFFLNPITPDFHIVTSYVMVFKKDLLMDGYFGIGLAFIFTNLTAFLINKIVNNSDLCNKPSFIYAFIYITLETSLRTNLGFYSWQIGEFLIIASFWPLLQIYNQRSVTNLGFEVGLLIGLATLFFQPSIIFLLIIPVFLQVFRPFSWREWLFPMIGFALIFLFYWTFRMVRGESFFTYFLFEKFDLKTFYFSKQLILIVLGILLLFALATYLAGGRKAIMHARKQRFVFIFMFLVSVTTITVLNYLGISYANYFLVLGIATVFIGYYLANTRFKLISETLFIALIISHVIRFYY